MFFSCNTEQETGFYHWKQSVEITQNEQEILDKTKAEKIYVRFFDVHWSDHYNAPVPESVVDIKSDLSEIEIVPTIYIVNEVMQKLDGSPIKTKDLAHRLSKKIFSIADSSDMTIHKVQIDCDWSQSSKESYFTFLEALKQELHEENASDILLSVTIRLHQVKYADRTGVPPVDEGMLMVYNMGKVNERSEKNSILNVATTKQYLSGYDNYPLPLNLALPAFSWGVGHYKYSNQVRLQNDLLLSDFEKNPQFEQLDENHFVAKEIVNFQGQYFSAGDTVRIEQPSIEDLQWTKHRFIKEIKKKAQPFEVVYYHLDARYLEEFLEHMP